MQNIETLVRKWPDNCLLRISNFMSFGKNAWSWQMSRHYFQPCKCFLFEHFCESLAASVYNLFEKLKQNCYGTNYKMCLDWAQENWFLPFGSFVASLKHCFIILPYDLIYFKARQKIFKAKFLIVTTP